MKRAQMAPAWERLYRIMLRLYPASFRQAYGEALVQAFRDECREHPDQLMTVYIKSTCDVLKNASAERLEQMTTRRRLLGALRLGGAITAYMLSWLGLIISVLLVTYLMLVPWEEGIAPTGTLAATVNDFFESSFILLPLFAVTICEIIAISRLTRQRMYSFSRIYAHFTAMNIAVSFISLVAAQLSMIVIGRLFPSPNPPVFDPNHGYVTDPNYGAALVYWGLIVVGTILAYFVRLAWRTRDELPLKWKRSG